MSELESLQLLRALDAGVAAKTGASFFPHLVSSLAQTLQASCAFAGVRRVLQNPGRGSGA